MQMDLRIKLIKNKLKKYLKNKKILDIIVFGSFVKGKEVPNDIDIAVISDEKFEINIPNFHVVFLKCSDFFNNPPTLINTLFREGYSLKNNKYFSEIYGFSSRVLYKYELRNLSASNKVKIVNLLRGKKEKGLVKENKGEWLANQIFVVPVENESIFERLFINFKIKYSKFYLLMH